MINIFAFAAGGLLLGSGFATLFIDMPNSLAVSTAHGIIHLLAGAAGFGLRRHHRAYSGWIGVVGSLLGLIGFSGIEKLFGFIDLPTGYNYFHALLGIAGLLFFFGSKPAPASSAPAASDPEPAAEKN